MGAHAKEGAAVGPVEAQLDARAAEPGSAKQVADTCAPGSIRRGTWGMRPRAGRSQTSRPQARADGWTFLGPGFPNPEKIYRRSKFQDCKLWNARARSRSSMYVDDPPVLRRKFCGETTENGFAMKITAPADVESSGEPRAGRRIHVRREGLHRVRQRSLGRPRPRRPRQRRPRKRRCPRGRLCLS